VPSQGIDIRLGDVVVGTLTRNFGGVVQYVLGKSISGGQFERTGMLNKPPQILLTAVSRLQADQMLEANQIPYLLSEMVIRYPNMQTEFIYRGQERDRLFDSAYDHSGHGPVIHYGLVASGNQVMKHGATRDREFSVLRWRRLG